MNRLTTLVLIGSIALSTVACESRVRSVAAGPMVCTVPHEESMSATAAPVPGTPDLSGSTRVGKASFYAQNFAYHVMANGRKMNPHGDNAASRTLPLGTTARVTNLRTGQTAVVSIDDRGPYVNGRIVDLSPATARKIGITRRIGVAQVRIAPISVALPDGSTKPGSGAPVVPYCRVYHSSADVAAVVNREPDPAFPVLADR